MPNKKVISCCTCLHSCVSCCFWIQVSVPTAVIGWRSVGTWSSHLSVYRDFIGCIVSLVLLRCGVQRGEEFLETRLEWVESVKYRSICLNRSSVGSSRIGTDMGRFNDPNRNSNNNVVIVSETDGRTSQQHVSCSLSQPTLFEVEYGDGRQRCWLSLVRLD